MIFLGVYVLTALMIFLAAVVSLSSRGFNSRAVKDSLIAALLWPAVIVGLVVLVVRRWKRDRA